MDFDVHHGNGTQEIFWADRSVLFSSTHQMPLYPGTGAVSERGEHDNIVNAPLGKGDDGEKFREALTTRILPRLDAFAPDLILFCAGFDAHLHDPLGRLRLVEEDFRDVTLWTTVSALNGSPLWNFVPCRRRNVQDFASLAKSKLSASPG